MTQEIPLSARQMLKKLHADFPIFASYQLLAIGINKQIRALYPDVPPRTIHSALHMHTQSARYLRNLRGAQMRYHLNGEPASEVAPEHREFAAQTLQARQPHGADQAEHSAEPAPLPQAPQPEPASAAAPSQPEQAPPRKHADRRAPAAAKPARPRNPKRPATPAAAPAEERAESPAQTHAQKLHQLVEHFRRG